MLIGAVADVKAQQKADDDSHKLPGFVQGYRFPEGTPVQVWTDHNESVTLKDDKATAAFPVLDDKAAVPARMTKGTTAGWLTVAEAPKEEPLEDPGDVEPAEEPGDLKIPVEEKLP